MLNGNCTRILHIVFKKIMEQDPCVIITVMVNCINYSIIEFGLVTNCLAKIFEWKYLSNWKSQACTLVNMIEDTFRLLTGRPNVNKIDS